MQQRRRGRPGPNRAAAVLAALALGLLPLPAGAQEGERVEVRDALGNPGNDGTGAAFWPQTPQDLALSGGELQVDGIEPVVLADPGASPRLMGTPAVVAVRGPLLHGEGDLLLIWVDEHAAVVRLPQPAPPAEGFGPGSLVVAFGPPSDAGILGAAFVAIWPAPPSDS